MSIKKYPFEYLFSGLFMLLAVNLNLQFLQGSNINDVIAGHDEYIAVKEVYSILHPASLKHFFMAVISGNALYYGRIMFYLDALVAWLPDRIWGVSGLVLSVRLFHSALMLVSFLMLAITFFENKYLRILFLIGSTGLYYSLYFIMMPKPEPHQMFFLALFFNRFKSASWKFGGHFLFLGIAYGLKFNVLLILPLIFLVALLSQGLVDIKRLLLSGAKAFLFFLGGLIIAIPCLILTPIRPIFLKTYLHETFGGTEKTYDDASLNFLTWLDNGLGDTYLGVGALAIPFVVFALLVLFMDLKRSWNEKDFTSPVFILSGLIFMVVIMLKTKRLWPHYLWTGYIFVILGMLYSISRRLKDLKGKLELTVMSLFIGSSLLFFMKRELPIYRTLESADSVLECRESSLEAINYLKKAYRGKRIGTDGTMLYPFEDFVQVDRFHPFEGRLDDLAETRFYWYKDNPGKIWEDDNDAVVFYQLHPDLLINNPRFKQDEAVNKQYDRFVEMTATKYEQDTSFGEIIIFRKR